MLRNRVEDLVQPDAKVDVPGAHAQHRIGASHHMPIGMVVMVRFGTSARAQDASRSICGLPPRAGARAPASKQRPERALSALDGSNSVAAACRRGGLFAAAAGLALVAI